MIMKYEDFKCEKCDTECEKRHMLTGYGGFKETCWMCKDCFIDEAQRQMYVIEPFTGRAIEVGDLDE